MSVAGAADRKRLLPNAFEAGLRRLCLRALGLTLTAAAVAGWLSLLTWSMHDPSLNHATRRAPDNLLGHAGAGIADLAFQLLGLGAIVLFLPLAAWGWHLMLQRPLRAARLRVLAALPAVLMAAGGLAALPVPAAWPLPNGFGGIMGDLLMATLRAGLGALLPGAAVALIGGLGLTFAGALALLYACGIAPRDLAVLWRWDREASSGLLALALGAPLHFLLNSRARLARVLGWRPRRRYRRAEDYDGEEDDDLDDLEDREAAARDDYDDIEIGAPEGAVAPSHGPFLGEAPVEPVVHEDGRIEPYFATPPGPRRERPSRGERAQPEDAEDLEEEKEDESESARDYRITHTPPPAMASRRSLRASPLASPYTLPSLRLLKKPAPASRPADLGEDVLQENARVLEGVLEDFGVKGEIINVRPGPVVTLYELEPAPGTKSSRVIGLADDIARSMSAIACRVAVIPGRNAIGIELPNARREVVYLRELLETEAFQNTNANLALALGKNIGGEPVIADLARMPHLLIAGTTGSGKSVGINTMILSLLYRLPPEHCKFIMIDPKMLELSVYDGIPQLLAPVVTDPKKALVALKWTVREMEERYKKMSKLGVRNIEGYNARVREAKARGEVLTRTVQTGFDRETGEAIFEREEMDYEPMPFIVVIVDEMADLMMVAGKEIEGAVQRLAQMARAAGIHLITATQRPSVDVITGTIKANFPTRVSFQVTSKIDSRTILGEQGAEQLLGQGDMLYMAGGGRIMRVHGPFVSDEEVEKVVSHLKKQGVPEYLEAVTEEDGTGEADQPGEQQGLEAGESGDELYDQAVAVVLRDGKASTSYIQRRLGIGYNKAATLIERMEEEGLISPANHAGKREILVGEHAERH